MANYCTNIVKLKFSGAQVKGGMHPLEYLSSCFEQYSTDDVTEYVDLREIVIGKFSPRSLPERTPFFDVEHSIDDGVLTVRFETIDKGFPLILREVADFLELDFEMIWYELGNGVFGAAKHDFGVNNDNRNQHYSDSSFSEHIDSEDIDFEGLEQVMLKAASSL